MSRVLFSLPVNSLAYSLGLAFHHLRRPLSLSPSPTGSCNSWTFLYIKLRLIAALWQAPATSVAVASDHTSLIRKIRVIPVATNSLAPSSGPFPFLQ